MLTNSIVAHGIALDSARILGKTVFVWVRREDNADGGHTVDRGLAIGPTGLHEIPSGASIKARYLPDEAVRHCIRQGITIPWRDTAVAAASAESARHRVPQAVWRIAADSFFTCHPSIVIDGAERLEVIYVS